MDMHIYFVPEYRSMRLPTLHRANLQILEFNYMDKNHEEWRKAY